MRPDPVVVVGSGASAVHFALTLLEAGRRVQMLDVGRTAAEQPATDVSVDRLADVLPNPVEYLLGPRFEGVSLPTLAGSYNVVAPWLSPGAEETVSSEHAGAHHGFPMQLEHVFQSLPQFRMHSDGFAPVVSFARGGLAEAWTAGAFELTDTELAVFPFDAASMHAAYAEVARRIGISGCVDDLAEHFPLHGELQPPLPLGGHAQHLLDRYHARREQLATEHGIALGRSRSAVLSRDHEGRGACTRLGRCVHGCPRGAIYAPRHTLEQCLRHPGFEYVPDLYVQRFEHDLHKRVTHVIAEQVSTGAIRRFEVGTLVLAAGTLGSSRIVLESLHQANGRAPILDGLMDTRMLTMPFVTPTRIGRLAEPRAFQFHQLCFTVRIPQESHALHGQLSLPETTSVHALAQALPLGLRTSAALLSRMRGALGMATLAFPDNRRPTCRLTLERDPDAARSRLVARYRPEAGEALRLRAGERKVRALLHALGCVSVPWLSHVRPPGAGIHYAGTLPMSKVARPLTLDPECRSHDFSNLFVIDGSGFPALPAKGPTLTLMANAVRVARACF